MKYARLWFVAAVGLGCIRVEPINLEDITDPVIAHVVVCEEPEPPDLYVPLPEPQPFFSFLDQDTGTWKR